MGENSIKYLGDCYSRTSPLNNQIYMKKKAFNYHNFIKVICVINQSNCSLVLLCIVNFLICSHLDYCSFMYVNLFITFLHSSQFYVDILIHLYNFMSFQLIGVLTGLAMHTLKLSSQKAFPTKS